MNKTGGLGHIVCSYLSQHGHHRGNTNACADEHIGFVRAVQHKIPVWVGKLQYIPFLNVLMQGIGHIARGQCLALTLTLNRNAQLISIRGL